MAGRSSMSRSVATTPPAGSCRRRSMSSARVALEKSSARSSEPAAASSRRTSSPACSAPRARSAAPVAASVAALHLADRQGRTRTETGSSGRLNGCASTLGSRSANAGWCGSGRRRTSISSIANRLTLTRPSSSERRVQSISTPFSRSHTPRSSAMVIDPTRARDDSAPETSCSRIWRPGAEMRSWRKLRMKPLSSPPSPASWASAATATAASRARIATIRLKTPARCRCRRRPGRRRRGG